MAQLYTLPTQRYAGRFLVEMDPTRSWSGVGGVTVASDGTGWLDLARLPVPGGTENRVLAYEISDGADMPVRTLRATVHMNTANGSLSSGAVESSFNRLSGLFNPAIFGGRRVIVQEPLAGADSLNPLHWRPRFWGHIDDHPANSAGDIQIFARDASARLMVPYTGDPVWIGTEGQLVPLDEAIQRVLDAATSPGAWALKSPGGDLEWAIPAFRLGPVSDVLQTVRDLAQQRGAVVRWWPDDMTGRFQISVFVLQENKSLPDATYTASQTVDIPAHGSDIASYRNDLRLRYRDSATGQVETIHRPATSGEILAFGKRPLVIPEPATSAITTSAAAAVMMDSVEGALRIPATVGSRLIPRNPSLEVNSLLRFMPDGRVSQEPVNLYVVNWTERVAMNGAALDTSMRVDLRGAPVGQIGAWLRSITRASAPPVIDLEALEAALLDELLDVETALHDLSDYLTDAIADGIDASEANTIAQMIAVLGTQQAELAEEYARVHGNPALAGAPRTNLEAAWSAYDAAHTAYVSYIGTATANGVVTPAEKATLATRLSALNTAIQTLRRRLVEAVDAIKEASIDAALGTALDELMDVAGAVAALEIELDEFISDGVISPAEAVAIGRQRDTITTQHEELAQEYGTLAAHPLLTGPPRTSLVSAFNAWDDDFDDLIGAITAIANAGVVEAGPLSNYANARTAYNATLRTLRVRIIEAQDTIRLAGTTTMVDDLYDAFSDLSDTIFTTFRDGVISQADANAITVHLGRIHQSRQELFGSYSQISGNPDLQTAPASALNTAWSNVVTTYNAFVAEINAAIADGAITPAERTAVNNAQTAFTSAIAAYYAAETAAQDAIKEYAVNKAYKPGVQQQVEWVGDAEVEFRVWVDDPKLRATAVQWFSTTQGVPDGSFSGTWDLNMLGVVGANAYIYRNQSITVAPGTDVSVAYRVTYSDHEGTARTLEGLVPIVNLQSRIVTRSIPHTEFRPVGASEVRYDIGWVGPPPTNPPVDWTAMARIPHIEGSTVREIVARVTLINTSASATLRVYRMAANGSVTEISTPVTAVGFDGVADLRTDPNYPPEMGEKIFLTLFMQPSVSYASARILGVDFDSDLASYAQV